MTLSNAFTEVTEQIVNFENSLAALEAQAIQLKRELGDDLARLRNSFQELASSMTASNIALSETVNRLAGSVETVDRKYSVFKSAIDPHNTQAAIERVNAEATQRELALKDEITKKIDQAIEDAYRSMDVRQELADQARAVLQTGVAGISRELTSLKEQYEDLLKQGQEVRTFLESRARS